MLDLTGIRSENEFFSDHYLTTIFEQDLQAWKTTAADRAEDRQEQNVRGLLREFHRLQAEFSRLREPEQRLELQREFCREFFAALGYTVQEVTYLNIDEGTELPLYFEVRHANGAPWLWIVEAFDAANEGTDLLDLPLHPAQLFSAQEISQETGWIDYVGCIFALEEAPRWLILAGHNQVILLDRTKWNAKRLLRFDLAEIYDRKEPTTFRVLTALLHKESLCPEEGDSWLDVWDENSHRHAFAVSEDLKYSLREAIELLGNEVIESMRASHARIYDRQLADTLTRECLRFMYRLLFLLYMESRKELGYIPINNKAYSSSYSIESLRALEMVPLTTEEARNGTYFHETLKILFKMVYEGFPAVDGQSSLEQHFTTPYSFTIAPLVSNLFNPDKTPLLNKAKLRNFVLQKIIRLLSLSREGQGRRRGRISYAQLGINQLGAVYESLLSFRGFFAEEDLYEVKKAGDNPSDLDTAYFVTEEELDQYNENERVYEAGGQRLRKHPKGKFIYRMSGRDRQKSASYYTPEVLTKCLVKYALKELLADKTADEILELTVCEPAMGSAAFLNEAINQLAEAYLERKEKELGQTIPHQDRAKELQKIKMYIADRNVYGVDLNPVAVELAEVSLWLNTIYEGAYVPWFRTQFRCGNSLIGARRQVFAPELLSPPNRQAPSWLKEAPVRVKPGTSRQPKTVYHFLVPDGGMANYTDRVIKGLKPDEIKVIKDWQKEMKKSFSQEEVEMLQRLSDRVDELWQKHTEHLKRVQQRTTDPLSVFGREEQENGSPLPNRLKDRVFDEEVLSEGLHRSSPYRRLKLVMDYWCALWFWPITAADMLPSRSEWLMELSLILEGNIYDSGEEQLTLFPDTIPQQLAMELFGRNGVNLDRLCNENKRLQLVNELAERYRFLHWELEFADVFADRGGFDLVLGNPPWIKMEWEEGDVLGDVDPMLVVKKMSATEKARRRGEMFERNPNLVALYLSAYEEATGIKNFLNAYVNFPMLEGIQTNLFKCFLPQAWMILNEKGVSGFVHPEGVYDDARGGRLRREIYKRLRYHFGFYNELMLFSGIDHHNQYSINIYNNNNHGVIGFHSISNLFHPKTIDESFAHNSQGPLPGIKTDDGRWETKGHRERIVPVNKQTLGLFASLYDPEGTAPLAARLPGLHAASQVRLLQYIEEFSEKFRDKGLHIFSTQFWNETGSQKDGTIRRETRFPTITREMILSGPFINVANPFFKTPRKVCNLNSDYDPIDLTVIPDNYLPRTNYVPNCDEKEFVKRIPKIPWNDTPVTHYYRLAFRRRLSQSGSRTMLSAIIPPGVSHIHQVQSTAFSSFELLVNASAVTQSLIGDFYIKTTGRDDLYEIWRNLPLLNSTPELTVRILALNCLTSHYVTLWQELWQEDFRRDYWTKIDQRLNNAFFANLSPQWQRNCSLRTDYARRQALVELDVLVAQAIGITLDELCTIYRLQFPVLYSYEQNTWYDQNGRIVFTTNRGLPGVGVDRQTWETIKDWPEGEYSITILDDTMPGGPVERTITYQAPFDRCDREEDYRIAWEEFERRRREVEKQ